MAHTRPLSLLSPSFRLRAWLVALFLPLQLLIYGQCTLNQPVSNSLFQNWRGAGQLFTVPCNGNLTTVTKPLGPVPDRIEVRSGSPTGPLLYSQLNPVMVNGTHTLTVPAGLLAGNTYAVLFYNANQNNGDGWNFGDVAPGNLVAYTGSSWTNFPNFDFRYSLTVVATINTAGPAGTSFCAGDGFSLPFTVPGTFSAGNTFTAQLSDAAGSFANPVAIGSVAGTTNGTIACTIPPATPAGTGYRVRVVSSIPATIGTPNGVDLTVQAPTLWYADVDADGLGDPNDFVLACASPGPGYVSNDDDPCPFAVDAIPNFNTATCGCDLGYFATIAQMSGNDVITACTICPPGSYCPDGITAFPCAAGAFSDVSGATSCTFCPAGSFSATTGSTVCESCPVGTFSAVTGSTSCAACPAGFANDLTGQTACSACPPGSFSANAGQAVCDLCPANTYNPDAAQTACLACPSGESSEVGATECTPDFICTTDLVIEFQTDGAPFETTWEIRTEDGQTVVASGGPLVAPFGVQTEFTCVADGCYTFAVLDAAGDGMSTGGYILRTLNDGLRIIDNRNNFSTGSTSAISGGQGFCVPMSTRGPLYTSCDKLDWVSGQFVVTQPDPAVSAEWVVGGSNAVQDNNSGYEFWIFDPNGSYSFRRFRSHNQSDGFGPASATRACHMKLNNWGVSTQVPANVLMNVRVRSRVNGENGPFGPACRLMVDPVRAACPLSKLMDIPGNQYFSCGVFRTWGTGNYLHARSVPGANRYQFRFRIAAEGFEVVRQTSTYFVQLNWPTLPLEEGKTYDVDVRVSRDGGATWCTDGASWGDVCQVTIGAAPVNANSLMAAAHQVNSTLHLFPNPNRGDLLTVRLDAVEAGVERVVMELYDLGGKRVGSHQLPVVAGTLSTTVDLGGTLAPGMYLVAFTAGAERYTERLVVQ
ncbi:MAG: T9SS type A sorting domain-containing protein [Flavobacteriales bacterium]